MTMSLVPTKADTSPPASVDTISFGRTIGSPRIAAVAIAAPDDAQRMFSGCRGLDGFYGASSMERLPTERAITGEVRRFRELRL